MCYGFALQDPKNPFHVAVLALLANKSWTTRLQ